jgi:putative hydrolase of the HAD superfamily
MIRALLFDLDNTLYSEATGLETAVLQRMNQFVADMFNLPFAEAGKFRREHAKPYGTTLEWLMREKGFAEPERYFSYIHPEGEEDCLEPDHVLRLMLNSIPLPKAVLTNAPREHAERILAKLGIAECFIEVYDIWFNELLGKPNPKAYLRALDASGFSLAETLFVDDLPKYVKGYVDLGGPAVLKDEMNRFPDMPCRRIKTIYELPEVLDEIGMKAS